MKMRELTPKQLENCKSKIIQERENLIYNKVIFSDEFNVDSEEMSDEVDQANASQASATSLRFRNRESFYDKKLSLALEKIKKGIYGQCEECQENIGYKRLLARPTAELCIACKEDSEREEYLSFLGQQSTSLGQAMNISAV